MWPVVSILNSAGGDKCGPRAYRAEQSGAGLALKRAVKTPLGCRLESLGVLLAINFHFSSFLFMTYRTPSLEPSPHIRPPIQVPRRPPPAPSPLLLLPTTLREAHLRIHFSAPRAMWMLWMLPFLSFNFLLLSRLVGTFASLGFHNNSTKGRGKGRAEPRPLLIGGYSSLLPRCCLVRTSPRNGSRKLIGQSRGESS